MSQNLKVLPNIHCFLNNCLEIHFEISHDYVSLMPIGLYFLDIIPECNTATL